MVPPPLHPLPPKGREIIWRTCHRNDEINSQTSGVSVSAPDVSLGFVIDILNPLTEG